MLSKACCFGGLLEMLCNRTQVCPVSPVNLSERLIPRAVQSNKGFSNKHHNVERLLQKTPENQSINESLIDPSITISSVSLSTGATAKRTVVFFLLSPIFRQVPPLTLWLDDFGSLLRYDWFKLRTTAIIQKTNQSARSLCAKLPNHIRKFLNTGGEKTTAAWRVVSIAFLDAQSPPVRGVQ